MYASAVSDPTPHTWVSAAVGIPILGKLFDLLVVLLDASGELFDHRDERHQCLPQTFRNAGTGPLVKRLGGPSWNPFAE